MIHSEYSPRLFYLLYTLCKAYVLFFQCYASCGDVKTARGYLKEDLNCLDTTDSIIGIKDEAIRIRAPFLIVHVDSRPGMPYGMHLTRNHPPQQTPTKALSTFKCLICSYNQLCTEGEYFQHIFQYLKNKETVTCMF